MTIRAVALVGFVLACGSEPSSEIVRVTIPSGATVTRAAESLATRGVIRSATSFKLWARITRKDRSIQAGVYDLPLNLSARDAIDRLVQGRTALDRLVIPEGLMLTELARAVETQLGISAENVLAAARDGGLREAVGARGETLEGYLYPTTYFVRVAVTAPELIDHMVSEFEAHWQPSWTDRLEELSMTRDEIVTLASILEGEARHAEDLGYVSSVYHNRLNRGMRLQADPTIIYALGRRRRLFSRDYEISSPYNTYQIDGLPPHPISQPSTAAFEAALFPQQSDFIFFVAGLDGRHVFSRTYSEHLAAIRRIRE